jgi:hypothetical protein
MQGSLLWLDWAVFIRGLVSRATLPYRPGSCHTTAQANMANEGPISNLFRSLLLDTGGLSLLG